MSPVTHTLLQLALSVLGSVAGGWLGVAFYDDGRKSIGPHFTLPCLVGSVAGFFVVFNLWDRFVPLCCPVCGGRMTKSCGEGRHLVFKCSSCQSSSRGSGVL
jgi:hypothetical protein